MDNPVAVALTLEDFKILIPHAIVLAVALLTLGYGAIAASSPGRNAALTVISVFGYLGAIVAALLLRGIFPAAAVDAVNLGTPLPGQGVSAGQALLVEIVLTFFLMFVIFGVAVDTRVSGPLAGLAIGLTITLDILMGGGISGAAMNPARSFGPAIVQNAWTANWVYWVGPILGGLAAALLYTFVLLEPPQEQEESVNLPQTERSDRSVGPQAR